VSYIISIIVSISYKTTSNADLQIYRHKLEYHLVDIGSRCRRRRRCC